MSNVKERILGAVTVMSEHDANTLWKIIIDNFSSWEDIPEVEPDEVDAEMLKETERDPDCQSFVPSDEAMREIGLQ